MISNIVIFTFMVFYYDIKNYIIKVRDFEGRGNIMINILSSKSRRMYNIIKSLPISGGFLSYEAIQFINSCSLNSAYNDVKTLCESWNELLELKIVDRGLITLSRSDSDFNYAIQSILSNEFELKMIMTIFAYPNKSTHEYAFILNCSESHFRKTIVSFNSSLKSNGIQIKYNNTNKTWVYYSKKPAVGARLMSEIYEITHKALPAEPIEYMDTFFQHVPNYDLCLRLNTLKIKTYLSVLSIHLNTLHGDKAYDYYKEMILNIVDTKFEPTQTKVLIKEAISVYLLEHIEDRNLSDLLYCKLGFMLATNIQFSKLLKEFNLENLLSLSTTTHRIKTTYPKLAESVKNMVNYLDSIFDSKLIHHYDEVLAWVYLNCNVIHVTKGPNVGIISSRGTFHAEKVSRYIYKLFPMINNLTILSEEESYSQTYDIIFSNSKNLLRSNNLKYKNCVILSDVISFEEMKQIYSSIVGVEILKDIAYIRD